VIDSHAATLTRRAERENFFMTTQGIVQLVQRLEVIAMLPKIFLKFIHRNWISVIEVMINSIFLKCETSRRN
jgi:hypothetical protein